MSVYYNDIDQFCCEWMRQLIKRGLVPNGTVDCRSIVNVKASDLQGFTQAHFFAGIGGWPYALKLAGWPEDVSIMTGSAPCQPWSSAGKRKGVKDERHLWPEFYQLIKECRPDVVIGEQVASADVIGAVARKAGSGRGETWLSTLQDDLEKAHYSTGAIVISACGFGAPHIRARLYWVAVSERLGWRRWSDGDAPGMRGEAQATGQRAVGGLDDSQISGLQDGLRYVRGVGTGVREGRFTDEYCNTGPFVGGLGNANKQRLERCRMSGECNAGFVAETGEPDRPGPTNGFWANPDWLWCRDKKWRPVKPGFNPLVDGFPNRMGPRGDRRRIRNRLQGYGNAIVVPQAVEFIKTVKEIIL